MWNIRSVHLLTGLLLATSTLITSAIVGRACGWDYSTDHSVRFNPYRNDRDFLRLPKLPDSALTDPDKLFSWDEDVEIDYECEEEERSVKEVEQQWTEAAKAEAEGNLTEAGKHLKKFLELTWGLRDGDWGCPENLQKRRNSAFDKLDALTGLTQGSPPSAVQDYLAARSAYDAGAPVQEITELLTICLSDRNLRDNAAYLEAALAYCAGETDAAVRRFADLARRYPTSEKREAAIFTAALASLKKSKLRDGMGKSTVELTDPSWQSARAGFQRVVREYPRGRYHADAQGWLAHSWLAAGDRPRALAGYYTMLGSDDRAARSEAVFSLRLTRRHADEADMLELEKLIEGQPATALGYAYHEIYNYAPSRHCSRDYDEKCNPDAYKSELKRIAAFATRILARQPRGSAGAGFTLRVAQADLELENDTDAARLARRALAMGVKGYHRAEALWVAGAAEHRLHRFAAARQALTALVSENEANRYTEGARRLLAMLLEDSGDLSGALDQYLALDYRRDVAYFVDVLMPVDQLAAFIEKRPDVKTQDELLYGLAIRYLRDRRWEETRRTLAKIRTLPGNADEDYLWRHDTHDQDSGEPVKLALVDPRIRGVRQRWVDRDLRTTDELERLERQVDLAGTAEAKAEALYQVASYEYEGDLLFYNPAAWGGERHYLLYDLTQSGGFRQPGESHLLFKYMQKHDCASNALPIFLDVVQRFPNSRAARDALYTAAVCHDRLSEYNNYWRDVYSNGSYAGPIKVSYADVRRTYPDYRLPRATLGWEPSTRTVNGGPGWDTQPRIRQPRPSRWERVKPYLDVLVNDFRKAMQSLMTLTAKGVVAIAIWWYHMVCALMAIAGIWFVWSNTADSCTQLAEEMSHCQARPQPGPGSRESTLLLESSAIGSAGYLRHDLRDELIKSGRDMIYRIGQLDRTGQTALVRSLVGVLLCSLLVMALLVHISAL
jgi:TolA-binding protein